MIILDAGLDARPQSWRMILAVASVTTCALRSWVTATLLVAFWAIEDIVMREGWWFVESGLCIFAAPFVRIRMRWTTMRWERSGVWDEG